MRRVVEKVKDIVEICPFTHLHDFAADPSLTLAGYHFTDITADLMSKWLDRAAAVQTGNGAALALAGFRGVGKSHFLSVIGAIAGRPELRSRISDPHVASSAERLPRRHGSVALVRRGTGTSLLDELKRAICPILELSPSSLGDSIYDLLLRSAEAAGDSPLVLLIDTAFGRESRVSRDDGVTLSEIGEAAKAIGVFVGVALDDDISGADGPNASISATFSIDYLDQEHLYRIVDSAIFSKHNQMRPLLHDIFEDYRADLPGFRWSEQRFSSLYPLHPATVEIAPLVRLYIQDFALLGFAADAGVKILGRPAHSLIGLDEVFDSTESRLRASPDLAGVFTAFETLEREVVAKVPVLSRHPAKLVLKGLLLLSLGGDGVTADEIAASMMISRSHALDVEALLDSFVAACGNAVAKRAKANGQACYGFRLAGKVDVEDFVAEAINAVPRHAVDDILRVQLGERFADFNPAEAVADCMVTWRGSVRRGQLVWPPDEAEGDTDERRSSDDLDWIVRVRPGGDDAEDGTSGTATNVTWKLGSLTPEDEDCLRRHYVLCRDAEIRGRLGDGLATAVRLSSITVEKIWTRVMFSDAVVSIGGRDFPFAESASASHTLPQLLSAALAPVFDDRFTDHPHFSEQLESKSLSLLIGDFLCGDVSSSPEAQRVAEIFAAPLGLAHGQPGALYPAPAESILELPLVRAVIRYGSESEVGLSEIAEKLRRPPFGFTRETQRLVLAALVAQRLFDFVTSKGDRINYRSLDLQIIWDDIVGIAMPLNELYSSERLLAWARLVTGNAALKSVDRIEDRLLITDSLAGWLTGWTGSRVLAEFDALPDELLSAGIWRTAANLRKSFGAMAEIIDALVKNDIALDMSLQSIADLFCDSETEYESKKLDLRVLMEFTTSVRKRSEIVSYLALCERTANEAIEQMRSELIIQLESAHDVTVPNSRDVALEHWELFRQSYTDNYAERHDCVMNSGTHGESLKEILRSDEWAVFESLAGSPSASSSCFSAAKNVIRELRQLYCSADVRSRLSTRPFCGCSFSLSESERLAKLPEELVSLVRTGTDTILHAILANRDTLTDSAESGAMRSSVGSILDRLADGIDVKELTSQEIRLLRLTLESGGDPASGRDLHKDDSIADDTLQLWETEVPGVEDFVNTELKM